MKSLPNLFFRIKDNGAAVYRIDAENRSSRMDMQHIAMVNVKNGKINPQGNEQPTDAEMAEITAWIKKRQAQLKHRSDLEIQDGVETLNKLAQHFQSTADQAQVDENAQDILLAIHDLRQVIVRRLSSKSE